MQKYLSIFEVGRSRFENFKKFVVDGKATAENSVRHIYKRPDMPLHLTFPVVFEKIILNQLIRLERNIVVIV